MPQHSDLQIWWIPQIPMKPFTATVPSVAEGRRMLDVLADYDRFQYEHNIKPDYANAGGLHVFDRLDTTDGAEGSWCEWEDEGGNNVWAIPQPA